jgi:DNA gyrase subunit A
MGRAAKGRHVANLLPLDQGERIATVIATKDFAEAEYLLFATKNGIVKKTAFGDYNTPLKNDGIIAINLADSDELIAVRQASQGQDVVLVSRNGLGIRFPQSEARPMGRSRAGTPFSPPTSSTTLRISSSSRRRASASAPPSRSFARRAVVGRA